MKEEAEDREDGEVYLEPNIDGELSKEKRQACRDIVQEIRSFGVSQRQILFLIRLLAMELENRSIMTSLIKAVGEGQKEVPAGNKLILPSTPGKKPPGKLFKA